MKTIMICAAVVTALAFTKTNFLTGKWQSQPTHGNVMGVEFKADNTFEGSVNMRPFVQGVYSLNGDTLSFVDNTCNDEKGVYKLDFFSGHDSLRFILIEDFCMERSAKITRVVMGRAD